MKPGFYRNYLLVLLLVILAFNFVDRLALGVMLENIKHDLELSDTQLGFMTGIAFALFYSVMGIPIARWADRGNRITIIAVTAALWSVAVALCGAAGNFVQLLLIRVGVAVGEAGCVPPAHSLIADHFSRESRPRAVATYMLGGPLSVVIGYFLAGWLNELYGWRATFVVLGLPGLVLAILVRATLKEPRESLPAKVAVPEQQSLWAVWCALWRNATFRHLLFFFSVVQFFGSGILQWQPTFFVRTYGMETGRLGTWLAILYGLGAMIGMYLGGLYASGRAASNERLHLRAMAVVYSSFAIVSAFIYLTSDLRVAFTLMAISAIVGATTTGPLFATVQTLVPPHMRATSIAIMYMVSNFIGLGLGPMAAGALSDALQGTFGHDSLRYALLLLCPGYLWGGWHLLRASNTVAQDLKEAIGREEAPGNWRHGPDPRDVHETQQTVR